MIVLWFIAVVVVFILLVFLADFVIPVSWTCRYLRWHHAYYRVGNAIICQCGVEVECDGDGIWHETVSFLPEDVIIIIEEYDV